MKVCQIKKYVDKKLLKIHIIDRRSINSKLPEEFSKLCSETSSIFDHVLLIKRKWYKIENDNQNLNISNISVTENSFLFNDSFNKSSLTAQSSIKKSNNK